MKNKEQSKKKVDRKVLSFFMLAFPTIIICVIAIVYPVAHWLTILLAIYQFLILKQFIDTYYGPEEDN